MEETTPQWAKRARRAVQWMNTEYDIDASWKNFPYWLEDVPLSYGERLRKRARRAFLPFPLHAGAMRLQMPSGLRRPLA